MNYEEKAREIASSYDLHCEAIDDPDIDKLTQLIAAALQQAVEEAREVCGNLLYNNCLAVIENPSHASNGVREAYRAIRTRKERISQAAKSREKSHEQSH